MGVGKSHLNPNTIYTKTGLVGKDSYIAPEITDQNKRYDWKLVDVFSFAKVILDLGMLNIVPNYEKDR